MHIELLQNMQLADYVVFFDRREKKFIGNYPDEWQAEYLRQSMHKYDVAVVKAADTFKPSFWDISKKKNLSNRQRKIMEMAKDFNIAAGITIPNYDKDKFLTFSFKHQKNLDIEVYKFITISILMFIKYDNKVAGDSFLHYLSGLILKLKNAEQLNNEILQELNCIRLFNQSLHRADLKEVLDRTILQSISLLKHV